MNSIDRKRLGRLYGVTNDWPWPNRGRTLTGADVAPFFMAMDKIQRLTMRAIIAISRCDDSDQNPDGVLDELENLTAALKEKAST